MSVCFQLFCILFLISCATPQKDLITFAVGGPPAELEFWETVIRKFEAEEHQIKVEVLRQTANTDQRRQALIIALRARQSRPDVILMDVGWIAQFAASDWLEPLDTYIETDNMDTSVFFKNVFDLADRYNRKTIAFPVYIDGGLLYYRKDLLKKYGLNVPKTWKELANMSAYVQKKERPLNPDFYGFLWQGAQYEGLICDFIEFAASNHGGIQIKDKRIDFDNKQNAEAMEFMTKLIHTYKISPPNTYTSMKEEDVRIAFQNGNALFERNWPYAWPLHQAEASLVKGKVGIAALPHFDGGQSVSTLGGWHAGISKFSKNKKAAWTFIRYITEYETQKALSVNLGWNPGRKDVYEDKDVLEKMPHFRSLKDVLTHAVPRPAVPYYTQISVVLQKYINAMLAGKMSVSDGLKQAEADAQTIINQYEKH